MATLLARALDGLLGTHRYGQLGWYGSPIATPDLGALAAGGLLYTNMHMTSEPDVGQSPCPWQLAHGCVSGPGSSRAWVVWVRA
jgi:hypothetical protein